MSGLIGELTSQLFVLPVMLTSHNRSYWKWNQLFQLLSVCSEWLSINCETLIWNPGWNRTRNVVWNSRIETDIRVHALSVTKSRIFSLLWVKQQRASDQSRRKKSSFAGFLERFEKTSKRWQAAHLHLRETFETFYILLIYCFFQGSSILKFERWYRFYIADQDTARYSLCSARENCVSWAEPLKCSTDNLFSSRV